MAGKAEAVPKAEEAAATAAPAEGKTAKADSKVTETTEALAKAKKDLQELQKKARAEEKAREKEEKQAVEDTERSEAEARRATLEERILLQIDATIATDAAKDDAAMAADTTVAEAAEATTTNAAADTVAESVVPLSPALAPPLPEGPAEVVPETASPLADNEVSVVRVAHFEPRRIYLDELALDRWLSPMDGSCFLYAADVADGTTLTDAFDFADGNVSPLEYEERDPRAQELVRRMRTQRADIVEWQVQPANFRTLINEHELHNSDGSQVSVAAASQYLDDRTWSRDAHIKARQMLRGNDIVSVTVHREPSGREYFLDRVIIYRSAGTQVQELTSYSEEIQPRLDAQALGSVETRVSLIEFAGGCHFNALIPTAIPAFHVPAFHGPGAASPQTITHALTLKGARLTQAILKRFKRIENRHFKIHRGWYALHTGKTFGSHAQCVLAANRTLALT